MLKMENNKCFNCDKLVVVADTKDGILTLSMKEVFEQCEKYIKIFGNSLDVGNPFIERTICKECLSVLNNALDAHKQFIHRTNARSLIGRINEETIFPFVETYPSKDDDLEVDTPTVPDFIEKRLLIKISKLSSSNSKTTSNLPSALNCSDCGRNFECRLSLERHYDSVHASVQKNWLCQQCHLTFTLKWFYKNHLKVVHGEIQIQFFCSLCHKTFDNKQILVKHQQELHGITTHPFKCNHCETAFQLKEITKLRDHLIQNHPDTSEAKAALFNKNYVVNRANQFKTSRFECPCCDGIFPKNLALQLHFMFEHGGQKNCSVCKLSLTSSEAMVKHVRLSRHKQRHCLKCDKDHWNIHRLMEHMDALHNPSKTYSFSCEVCGIRFYSMSRLKFHYDWHVRVARVTRFHCNICEKYFSLKHQLGNHMKIHLKKIQSLNKNTSKKMETGTQKRLNSQLVSNKQDKSAIKCEECGGNFRNALSLAQHRRTHFLNDFGPNQKKEQLVNEAKYISVITTTNGGDRRFICALCQRDFKRNETCLRHLFRKHSIKLRESHKSYGINTCPICAKQLVSPASLKKHMQLHKKNPQKKSLRKFLRKFPVKCPICNINLGTETIQKIRKHFTIEHAESKEAKYARRNADLDVDEANNNSRESCERNKCSSCRTLFPTVAEKDVHDETLHKLEIKCLLCETSFRHEADCREHERNHMEFNCRLCGHPSQRAEDYHSHFEEKHLKSTYICEFCGKCFSERKLLVAHYRQHTDAESDRPFCCLPCGKRFSTEKYLKNHKIKRCGDNSRRRNKHACKLCSDSFVRNKNLARHMEDNHKMRAHVKCQVCTMLFFTDNALAQHLRKAQPQIDGVNKGLGNCDTESLAEPMNHLPQVPQRVRKSRISTSQQKYFCEACKFGFRNLGPYNYHAQKYHWKHTMPHYNQVTNKKSAFDSAKIKVKSKRTQRKGKMTKDISDSSSEESEYYNSNSNE